MDSAFSPYGAETLLRGIEEVYNATAPAAAITCPNYETVLGKICISFYSMLAMGWEFFKFFDWFLFVVAVPAALAYAAIACGFVNAYREGQAPNWNHLRFRMAVGGVVMHVFAAWSHLTLYFLSGDTGTAVFTVFWAISFVLYWIVTIGIVAYYFNYYILKWSDVTTKSATSAYVYASCGVATAAALSYGIYIVAVTIKYKSKEKDYVDAGWYIMMVCYFVVAVNVIPMFWVVKFVRKRIAAGGQKKRYRKSARFIVWWTGITFALQLFSIITIAWFNFYKADIPSNLPADQALLLKRQRPIMQSLLTRFCLNIWNNIQSVINIYFLSLASTNLLPFVEIVYFFSKEKRQIAYRNSAKSNSHSKTRTTSKNTDASSGV